MDAERITIDEDTDAQFVSELFHENTKQRRSDTSFIERIMATTFDPFVKQMVGSTRKDYPVTGAIALPTRFPRSKLSLDSAILSRRSSREFSGRSLRLREVAKLLHFANGVTGVIDAGNGLRQPVRSAPSGGALYPVEIYVLPFKVIGLHSGVYHYSPAKNRLEGISSKNPVQEVVRITHAPELRSSGVVMVLTGISMKSRFKYGERGYRFMLLEAGHVAQNLLLTANALMLRAFSIGGFVDDEIDTLLDIDGFDETSLYLVAVGRGPQR